MRDKPVGDRGTGPGANYSSDDVSAQGASRRPAIKNTAPSREGHESVDAARVAQRVLIGVVGAVTVIAAASALFQFGSRNDTPINQIEDPTSARSSLRSSSPAPDTSSGFLGITTLPADIQSVFPDGTASRVATCVESDSSLPTALGGATIPGFTCLLPLDMGANVVVTVAQSPEAVERIRLSGPSLEAYTPAEFPNASGFAASVQGTEFLMMLHEDKGIFQEYSCNGVLPDEVDPCMAELRARTGAQPAGVNDAADPGRAVASEPQSAEDSPATPQ